MQRVNPEIILYVQENILPRYQNNDEAHGLTHVLQVMDNAMALARDYDIKADTVYTAAAYHDLGIPQGRADHHLTGGAILAADPALGQWFSPEEITLMREAVEDHRASSANPPRSLCGCILAEADRDLRPEEILRRTWLYGLRYFPDLTRPQQLERLYAHMLEKYAEGGYLRLWLHAGKNVEGLSQLRAMIHNKEALLDYVLSHADQWEMSPGKDQP